MQTSGPPIPDQRQIYALAFISGACSLLVEIAGARALYPYIGNTIFTWAGNIAVVLGFLTIGYWWGGKSADKNRSPAQLSLFMFLAAVSTAIIPFMAFIFGPFAMLLPARIASILLPFIIAPASFFYGTFCPYAIKLTSKGGREGSGSGNIFSISTFGSIAGVLLTAFVLIPNIELGNVFFGAAILMAISSFFLCRSLKRGADLVIFAAFVALAMSFNMNPQFGSVIFQKNTPYALLTVTNLNLSGNQSRVLMLDNSLSSGESGGLPVFNYMLISANSFDLLKDPKDALVLGTAAGIQVEQIKRDFSSIHVDAVDIDKDAIDAGVRYFSLKEDNRTTIFIDDARHFVSSADKSYDLVIVDVFRSNSPPPHIATVEFVRSLKSVMEPDAAVAVNLIGTLKRGDGYIQYMYDTYRSQFDHVYIFPSADEGVRQNVVLIATDRDNLAFEQKYLNKTYQMIYDPGLIFSDSKNPVELLSTQ